MGSVNRIRAALGLAAAVLAGLALGACGGDSRSGASPPAQEGDRTALDALEAQAPTTATESSQFHPVAGNFAPNETELADCSDSGCYEQAFGNLAFYEGPKAALTVFDEKIAERGPIEANCHRIVHMIGSAALARYEGNVARAFSEGSASCWSGYYHGILERAFTGATTRTEVGQLARGICDDAEVRRITWIAYQCVHGLGHGLMIRSGYDLPYALDVCRQLGTDWDRQSCKGGVFMENINSSYGFTSEWVKEDDGVYPCQAIAENDKLYCYLMVTSRILRVEDWDWEKTAQICAGVERDWVATCFQSYGRDASGSTRQAPKEILSLCRLTEPYDGVGDCVSAAAKDMTANYASGTQASELCELAPAKVRGGCYYAIGAILGSFYATTTEREAGCREVSADERYFAQCLRGADPAAAA